MLRLQGGSLPCAPAAGARGFRQYREGAPRLRQEPPQQARASARLRARALALRLGAPCGFERWAVCCVVILGGLERFVGQLHLQHGGGTAQGVGQDACVGSGGRLEIRSDSRQQSSAFDEYLRFRRSFGKSASGGLLGRDHPTSLGTIRTSVHADKTAGSARPRHRSSQGATRAKSRNDLALDLLPGESQMLEAYRTPTRVAEMSGTYDFGGRVPSAAFVVLGHVMRRCGLGESPSSRAATGHLPRAAQYASVPSRASRVGPVCFGVCLVCPSVRPLPKEKAGEFPGLVDIGSWL